MEDFDSQAVHGWFELSYANYLTIPRCVLEAMPGNWQKKFVKLMTELDDTIDWRPHGECQLYMVQLVEEDPDNPIRAGGEPARYLRDPLIEYRHGNKNIIFKKTKMGVVTNGR